MMECRLAGETEVLGENLPQHHFCPSQNPTCPPGFESGPPRWEAGDWPPKFEGWLLWPVRSYFFRRLILRWMLMTEEGRFVYNSICLIIFTSTKLLLAEAHPSMWCHHNVTTKCGTTAEVDLTSLSNKIYSWTAQDSWVPSLALWRANGGPCCCSCLIPKANLATATHQSQSMGIRSKLGIAFMYRKSEQACALSIKTLN
jgi:hypothetical protein